ncbi:MAG: signal peptide peptidase SppA [Gammaproteobacteria bacterium]|nr:MAG: signal peptide peptidase SppA [Gammaproteobacteria bacterium]RLA37194.1 MAG: signal peptide peptidase SppA [Gammaproteobacteria bacterium]
MSIRKAVGRLFSMLWTGVDTVRKILHLLILLMIFSVVIGALSATGPLIPKNAALVIRPVGNIVEQLEGDPYDRALAELMDDAQAQTLVQDIVDGLQYAKDDDRIAAVFLDLSAIPGGGLSKLQRIGEAIDDFRSADKIVIANADFYGQGSYYLASHADEIYMHPEGLLLLRGFGIYQNYFKQAIDNLKIDWNVFRVGTHKSFTEPYTSNSMSDPVKESMASLLDQLWGLYKHDIQTARGIDENTIDNLLENLIANTRSQDAELAELAVELGFVDELLTRDEVRERLIDVVGTDSDNENTYAATELGDYLGQMRLLKGDKAEEENVAIIIASGEIRNGTQPPGTIGGDSIARLLRKARNDDSVKAVVLRVDSPGGSTFASEVIRNEVDEIKAAGKPIVVSMSSLAASGGYWISMTADRIYATPYTITGSIGVLGMFPTFQRSLDTLGITTDGVGTTLWAGEFRGDREMSEEAKALFQLLINKTYDKFISNVATHRGIDKDEVDGIAQGQVWTGNEALENGLIDEIGNIDEAIAAAAELADLEEYGEKYFEKELSPGEQMVVDLFGSAKQAGFNIGMFTTRKPAVERLARIVDKTLAPLFQFNDPKGVYAHCFCVIE